jgi:hypothetical protein
LLALFVAMLASTMAAAATTDPVDNACRETACRESVDPKSIAGFLDFTVLEYQGGLLSQTAPWEYCVPLSIEKEPRPTAQALPDPTAT